MACPWTMTATLRPLLRGLLVEDGLSATLNIHWLLINTARTCFDVRFNTQPFSRNISWCSAWGEPAASHQRGVVVILLCMLQCVTGRTTETWARPTSWPYTSPGRNACPSSVTSPSLPMDTTTVTSSRLAYSLSENFHNKIELQYSDDHCGKI